jgi:hypothetical protein
VCLGLWMHSVDCVHGRSMTFESLLGERHASGRGRCEDGLRVRGCLPRFVR